MLLLLKNLAATTSAVVARLDRLEGAHFDARGPAAFGATGSTAIETPDLVIKVCSSAQVSSSTGSSSAGDVPTAECEPAPLSAPAHPPPQTVVDYIDTPPCSTPIQLSKSRTVESDCGFLVLEKKTMTVAASSAVPSRLLLLTTRRPSSKSKHLFVGAQFDCGFEMSADLKMFKSSSPPKFYAV